MENHLAPHSPYGEVQLRIVPESFFILIVGVDYILAYVKSREGNFDADIKKLLTSQKRWSPEGPYNIQKQLQLKIS